MANTSERGELLDDFRVLDLTDHRGELGPWFLGRLGAEVIRIEPPGGSPARYEDPLVDAAPKGLQSLQFASYNDNKRSVVLDLLGSEDDRSRLLDLVAGTEIVFDSGPPGALAAAGITEADLETTNPELVYVLITPFGADGPRANDPHSELTIAALSGSMSLQGIRERAPLKVSVPQVWRHTGAEAATAALVGYARMQRSGGFQSIDVSAQNVMTWTMLNAMEADEVQGFDFERAGSTVTLAQAFEMKQAASDGYVICPPIGLTTGPLVPWLIEEGIVDRSWAEEDWATYDHRALSGESVDMSYADLKVALTELCSRFTCTELMERALSYEATIAPINTIPDLLKVDHLDVRQFWVANNTVEGASGIRRVGGPIRVNGKRCDQASAVPALDEAAARLLNEPTRSRRARISKGDKDDLPFAGLKIADFSWVGVGPITAKCLADHGATVVRIETESRLDTLRAQPPFKDGEFGLNRSNFYGTFNTSKLSISLDITTEAGHKAAKDLANWADIVIDSFRAGTMERLGLGHDDIAVDNPSVITVETSLLGTDGPLSNLAGYGFHASALAGFTELVGWPDLGPDGPWMAYTDTIAPRFLTAAIIAAVDRRNRTGEGCHIEAAQLEVGLQLLAPELLNYQVNGRIAARLANRDLRIAPQGAYPCSGDDEWCTLTIADDDCWSALRELLGDPEWARRTELESAQGRLAHHDEIDERLAGWTSSQAAEDVERSLLAAGIPAGKVQRTRDLRVDPQYLHRDFYRRLEHSEVGVVPYAGHQYRIQGYDHGPRLAAPMLGEHTYQVLSDLLGMTADEIADLAASGALA